MIASASLVAWAAIVDAPVLGRVGHHRTYDAGPAHPIGHAPAWVTAQGCDLARLHATHSAYVVHECRGEALECQAQPAKRPRKRVARTKGNVLKMARRSA